MVAVANFPNKTCDLAAEKVSFSKFRFKGCGFGTTTPTANSDCKTPTFGTTTTTTTFGTTTPTADFEPKNRNFWHHNHNHNFWERNSNPPYKFSKLCNKAVHDRDIKERDGMIANVRKYNW